MKKLIVFTVLLMLPALISFARSNDGPKKSVSSQIRVIIPPFAVIRLADNSLKEVPIDAVSSYMKQSNDSKASPEHSNEQSGTVESNQDIVTNSGSKTEKTSFSLQITTTYTSTQQ